MNVQEIIDKVKGNMDAGSDTGRIELPKEDPLWYNYKINVGESIRISGYIDRDDIPLVGKDVPDVKEDILLQDLISNYSDKAAPKFEEMDAGVLEKGIEALAWYVPFHYETRDHPWGIHLLDKGIWKVVNELNPLRENNFVTNDLIVFAARILFWHEFFHFLNEIAASTIEITSRFHRNNYHDYREKVYSGSCQWDKFGIDRDFVLHRKGSALEEALANAYCYRQFQKPGYKGVTACLQPFMRRQPPGYRDFDKFPFKDSFHRGCSILGSLLSDTKSSEMGSPYESLFDIYRKQVKITDVPVYLVRSPENELRDASIRIFKWEPPRKEKWIEHSSFKREWKKATRGKSETKIRSEYQTSKEYAASPDQNDRDRVGVKRILTHRNLYEFRLNAANMRVFYQVCEGGIPVICGIKPKSELTAKNKYNEIYRSDYCVGQ